MDNKFQKIIDYKPQSQKEIICSNISYHVDEVLRAIDRSQEMAFVDQRKASIIRLKMEEVMVWLKDVDLMKMGAMDADR